MEPIVQCWQEKVTLPTYGTGEPEKYPVFLEKRVYQGSSGRVYPFPVVEKILDEKGNREWTGLFLENPYLKIMILPELGGRVHMAYDKVKGRHFVYYNQVIKPALVGLTGPWISGGIEFNWPQHHRPSTCLPVNYCLRENADGSKSILTSEIERMNGTKGMARFTLYPDKAYLEISVNLFNRTPQPQTFLWWANPAVKVNDHYQSVFPPDVNAVFDHGKRDVSTYPVATGTYYKVDYSEGVDISRYRNLPVPTSFMAVKSVYDFIGGYEHDTRCGILHVADHHIAPGKKQWTWGNGDFGKAWDRNLTDEDGPYIELMCGVFTDNQPDFAWLHPYEEKSFRQYFLPYSEVGLVKNATRDFLINLETVSSTDQKVISAVIRVFSTGIHPGCRILIESGNRILSEKQHSFVPGEVFSDTIPVPADIPGNSLTLKIFDSEQREKISWSASQVPVHPVPDPATAAPTPGEVGSNDMLYLLGLHIEQYRHATYRAQDYYEEALRREPGDVRVNNAMGSLYLRSCQFSKAESYFRKAVATATTRNPNPYDGESVYNLGLSLFYQDRFDEALDCFYKSVWNSPQKDAGYYYLALLSVRKGDYPEALEFLTHSLSGNSQNQNAIHLKVLVLRLMGNTEAASRLSDEALETDPFHFGVQFEQYLLKGEKNLLQEMLRMMRYDVHLLMTYAADYGYAGRYGEALALLAAPEEFPSGIYPMVEYLRSYYTLMEGNVEEAAICLQHARRRSMDHCFPNRPWEIIALQAAIQHDPSDFRARYYLGNYWYASAQISEAVLEWEAADRQGRDNPFIKRNLALAFYNHLGEPDEAFSLMEEAIRLDPESGRLFMEFDQLCKKMNLPASDRLDHLRERSALTTDRDDLYLEYVALHNFSRQYETGLKLITSRKFHPWEGGEGKVTEQYVFSLVELAKSCIQKCEYNEAADYLERALVYPENLGEGRLAGATDNDIHFWLGYVHERLGNKEKAEAQWRLAVKGSPEPAMAMYYNDNPPEFVFYQGLALQKLGDRNGAMERFNRLVEFGTQHRKDEMRIDYFAVSLPDLLVWNEDLTLKNLLHCDYMKGLGELGMGNIRQASALFDKVLILNAYHRGAFIHRELIEMEIHDIP